MKVPQVGLTINWQNLLYLAEHKSPTEVLLSIKYLNLLSLSLLILVLDWLGKKLDRSEFGECKYKKKKE